jgi:hypothetical protein
VQLCGQNIDLDVISRINFLILKNLKKKKKIMLVQFSRFFLENCMSKLPGSLSIPCPTLTSWEDGWMGCGARQKLAPPKLPNCDKEVASVH